MVGRYGVFTLRNFKLNANFKRAVFSLLTVFMFTYMGE